MNERPAGLCAECRHRRRVPARDGRVYWRCAAPESPWGKYPRLPVLECAAFEEEPPGNGDHGS